MNGTLIIAARAGDQRQTLISYFAERFERVVSLERERIIADQRLHLESGRVLLDDRPLLDGAVCALVADSGYMWPMPLLQPDEASWQAQRERFDDYLRDHREADSLWYSLLGILNDRLPLCINHQDAFFLAAARPEALDRVRATPMPVVDSLISNDPDVLADFSAHLAPGGALLALAWSGGLAPMPPERLADWPLDREPLCLARCATDRLVRAVAVEGQLWPGDIREQLPPKVLAALPAALDALRCVWCELTLAVDDHQTWLVDYDPSPDLAWLAEPDRRGVLDALYTRLRDHDEVGV